MRETRRNSEANSLLRRALPGAVVYKHHDRSTKGMPDTSVTWRGATTWLEFKVLRHGESIYKQLDPLQLIELVKIEQAGSYAWVVALRHPENTTEIYRPTWLVRSRAQGWVDVIPTDRLLSPSHLLALSFPGRDLRPVIQLIERTHVGSTLPRL